MIIQNVFWQYFQNISFPQERRFWENRWASTRLHRSSKHHQAQTYWPRSSPSSPDALWSPCWKTPNHVSMSLLAGSPPVIGGLNVGEIRVQTASVIPRRPEIYTETSCRLGVVLNLREMCTIIIMAFQDSNFNDHDLDRFWDVRRTSFGVECP